MFNLNLKINLKLNATFTSNSVSFENQFKFHFISGFLFQIYFESVSALIPILKIYLSMWPSVPLPTLCKVYL